MRRLTSSLVVSSQIASIILLSATLARAGDDFKWDPKKKATPKVGDRSFDESDDATKTNSTVTMNQKVVKKSAEDVKTTSRIVTEVLAVEDGKVTKRRINVEKWKQSRPDKDPDTSLEGKTVLVEGRGEATSYTIEGADKDAVVSDAATKWITSELAKKKKAKEKADDEMMSVLGPPTPVGNDAEWTGDPKAVAKAMFEGAEIDEAKSSVKGKLTNVRVEHGAHMGHLEITVKMALKKVPGAPFDWTEGGVMEMTVTGEAPLEEALFDGGDLKMTMKLDGKAEVKAPQGMALVAMNMDMASQKKHGPAEAKKP